MPEEVLRELLSEGQIVKLDPMFGKRISTFIGPEVVGEENKQYICLKSNIEI